MPSRFALLAIVLLCGCRTVYVAPPGPASPPPVAPVSRGNGDEGDLAAIRELESVCRRTLEAQTVAASLVAIDALTETLGSVCSLEPVDDDPLLWRVWCRADALFQSGHYLRSSTAPSTCQGTETQSAFECAGRILASHLLVPGHAEGVEVVSVGHVDRQRLASGGAFVGAPCPELQQEFAVPASARWAAPETGETPDDDALLVWNDRLSWCRAAYGASQTLRGLRAVAGSRRQRLDVAVVGAGTEWLEGVGRCPEGAGSGRGSCAAARRVDVLLRFEPAERLVEQRCAPPGEIRGDAAQVLYCYEDCAVVREVGRVRQRYLLTAGRTESLFGGEGRAPGGHWIIHRAQGATGSPVNVPALRRMLGIGS